MYRLLPLLFLVACANMPVGATHEIDLEQLTLQATTLDEAEAFLGPPARVEGLKNGSVILSYALSDPWNQGGDEILLFFDSAHTLVGKAYVEDDDDQERT